MSYRWRYDSPAMEILRLLQRRGSASVKDIKAELGVTTTAVRMQLSNLQAEGVVETRVVRKGVGRPHYEYSLTEKAANLFPCYGDELMLALYEELMQEKGSDMARRLLDRVSHRLAMQYTRQIQGETLNQRVESLVSWLNARGILAEFEVKGDEIVLKEYNCPYHKMARKHHEICEVGQKLIAELLGAGISLTQSMMDGHAACQFRITTSVAETPTASSG
ncbi:MAG: ArsR family transcriptional regulator [Anaerolineae bacterium]|nr:ArsR family transcriptional regulator [Anaerolineae bacterium]